MKALVGAQKPPAITVVGKSWDFHVTEVLRVTLEENIDMISESVAYPKRYAEVIYDAEHFFDGYRLNPTYARSKRFLEAAADAGATGFVLWRYQWRNVARTNCLNGWQSQRVAGQHRRSTRYSIAATTAIWPSPIRLPQSMQAAIKFRGRTINGIGERCGNADLVSVMANLALKKRGYQVLDGRGLSHLSRAFALNV
jgi:2-isopropylmalate synthase